MLVSPLVVICQKDNQSIVITLFLHFILDNRFEIYMNGDIDRLILSTM